MRAPHFMDTAHILRFVKSKSNWIEKRVRIALENSAHTLPKLESAEEKKMRKLALDAFIERSCYYGEKMGVRFKKIRLSSAKTRWGSCSLRGNLSFNWKLIQAPVEILNYVVVHELAHLVEHNHSPRFWAKVAEFHPDFKTAKQWLKKHEL